MPNYKKQSRKSGTMLKMKGGAGAADYAIATYGGMGQQHAEGNTNVIATNHGLTMQQGGSGKKKGGMGLTEIAVPAVLLVANQVIRRRMTNRKSNKSRVRFSRRRSSSRKMKGG